MSPPVVAGWYQSRVARNRTLSLDTPDRLPPQSIGWRVLPVWAVRDDVPDHQKPNSKPGPERAAGAFRHANPLPECHGNLDQGQAAIQGDEEHVRREVIAAHHKVGQDPLQRILPNRSISAAHVADRCGSQELGMPETKPQQSTDGHVAPSKEV